MVLLNLTRFSFIMGGVFLHLVYITATLGLVVIPSHFQMLKMVVVHVSVTLYTYAWGNMETAEVAVHLIPLLHLCGVLLVENGPEYHQWGKHPQERDQLPPPQEKRLQ